MARAKYKLGTFVKTAETEDNNAHYGAVEEIRLTAAGTSYKLTGLDDAVTEDDIEQGYRAIVQRTSKPRTAKGKGGKKSSRASAEANAAA